MLSSSSTERGARPPRGFVPGVGAILLVAACSDSTGPTSPASGSLAEFVAGLPSWTTFAPPLPDSDAPIEGSPGEISLEFVEGATYDCTVSPYSITQTPDKIVTLDPDVNVLWLGALLQGRGYKEGIGSLAEWAVRERAPLQVSVDLLTGENFRTVEDPTPATVNQAIGELVEKAEAAGHRGGSSISFSQETTHSISQAAISLGVSYRFVSAGIKASLSASASRRVDEKTITAYFVQRMFTASIALPTEASDLFSEDFTAARLEEEVARGTVGTSNLPVYVANVAYGRILMFSMTSTAREDSIRAAISAASAKDDSVGISAAYKNILQTAKISVVTVGGEGKNAAALIRSGNIADYFNDDAALTSARPISYTVRNLGDNSIALVSETTEYNLRECTALPTTGDLKIDVAPNDATVTVVGADDYGPASWVGDRLVTQLATGGYVVSAEHPDYATARNDTVTVVAGETTEVILSLLPIADAPVGAIYRINPTRLTLRNASCTGESQPDLFHTATVNGKTLVVRTEENAISLYEGQSDDPTKGGSTWTAVTDTLRFEEDPDILFELVVQDDDGGLNFNDLVATGTARYVAPNVPTGSGGFNVSTGGCQVRLEYNVTKLADLFDTP